MKNFLLPCVSIFLLTLQVKSQFFKDFPCYVVAHNNGNANILFEFDPITSQWIEVGLTGTNNIKAIAADQTINKLYAVDKDRFGVINPNSGLFTQYGVLGQANGDVGLVNLDNIYGLTFDPTKQEIYATHRVESGDLCNPITNSNDLLFKIDITTGKFKPQAMMDSNGNPADYAVIKEIPVETIVNGCGIDGTLNDVNDIAYNAYTGELYAIQNQEFVGAISIINKLNASVEQIVHNLEDNDLVGLAFNSLGELFGTSGSNAANEPTNCLKYIDLHNQLTINFSFPDKSGTNFDFRALDSFTPYNDLALKLTIDPNTPDPFRPDSKVTFLITLYNQGELHNDSISIVNYIPNGLLLNDVDWTLIPGSNNAIYHFKDGLAIGEEATIPISFISDANFPGDSIINCAEISASFNKEIADIIGYLLPMSDIDSSPDDTNNEVLNGDIIIDNAINQGGPYKNEDEDDHDIATIHIDEELRIVPNPVALKYSPCYTVNEGGVNNPNMLFEYDPSTQSWTIIGEIDPIGDLIEAIATDPINDIIYAYDAGTDVLGIINPNNQNSRTLFTPIGSLGEGVGTANGDYGPVKLDDVDGLTYDPVNKILYGTHRIKSGFDLCNPEPYTNDVLFQIDVSTGMFVPGAMVDANNNPSDYAIVEASVQSDLIFECSVFGNNKVYDVDDIAYNPYTGQLFAISNQETPSCITLINPKNGKLLSTVYEIDMRDVEGLGISYTGKLYGTNGDIGATDDKNNNFLYFDTDNETETRLQSPDLTGVYVDFEAFDCFTAFNDLALSYTFAPENPFSLTAGTEVTFLANIYNQGDFTNTNITIINYVPAGLTLADEDWGTTVDDNAIYTITDKLAPGDLKTIPIKFIIEPGFEGQTITGSAEIAKSFGDNLIGVNGSIFDEPLPDVDSRPDGENNDDLFGTVTDNETDGRGPNAIPAEDEDDHDVASITIDDVIENLPLLTTITPAFCNGLGTAQIEILDSSIPPYTYKLLGPNSSLVHSETTTNTVLQVTGLSPGTYYAIVSDAESKTTTLVITISELAQNDGNANCDNACPKTLVTPNDLLNGVFQAEEAIEVKGFVEGSQNAEFRICD